MNGLNKFVMCKVPNGYNHVDMIEKIKNYKMLHNRSPTIVIDLVAITFHYNTLNNICGGRYHHVQLFINFLDKLKEYDVNFIFVKKISELNDIKKFKLKLRQKYNLQIQTLDLIENDCDIVTILKKTSNKNFLIPITLKKDIAIIAERYGPIFQAIGYFTVPQFLASIAYQYKAIAVISDKMNVLFYEGDFEFWSGKDIDFNLCTTKEFNRKSFCDYLKISQQQLKLYLTIIGNCIVPRKAVTVFLNQLGKEPLLTVANYVRKYPEQLTDEHYVKIASDINCNQNLNLNLIDLIKQSVKMMELVEIEEKQDKTLNYIWKNLSDSHYLFVADMPFGIIGNFFDSRKNVTPYPDLIIPLLRNKLGILLQHKNDPHITRSFYSQRQAIFWSTEIIKPIFPPFSMPPLLELLDRENNKNHDEIRFKLLCWAISDKIQPGDLETISDEYFVLIITLHYMVKEHLMEVNEADLLLLTTNAVIQGTIPNNIAVPTHLKLKPFCLTYLYAELLYEIQTMVEVVGLKKKIAISAFDGVYFHYLYNDWATSNSFDIDTSLQTNLELQNLRKFYTEKI